MIFEARCKFCSVPLRLEIDPDYFAMGDPHGLLKLASCNHCADLRVRRRSFHEEFVRVTSALIANPTNSEVREHSQKSFERLTKGYLRLIADWTSQQLAWEEEMIGPFMAAPKHLSAHLKRLWSLTKQQRLAV